jgi:hypothetical protein
MAHFLSDTPGREPWPNASSLFSLQIVPKN